MIGTSKPKKTGWALLRVSTTGQGKVQHGSLEQQDNRIHRWAEQASDETGFNYEIVRTISERRSGKKDKFHLRAGFQETIFAIEKRQIDFIVIESVARMGRWARKNLEVIEIAAEQGVEVWFIDGGRYDHLIKGDRIKFGINNLMAEEESKDNEERVTKKQREAMVNNGKDIATRAILGLDPHPQKVGMYVPNAAELEVVKDTLEKFCELKSLKHTVQYCLERGYLTKERITKESVDENGNIVPPRKVGGEAFDDSRLRAMLCNPKYRGYNEFRDDYNQFPKLQGDDKIVRWEYAHHRQHGPVLPTNLLDRVDATLKLFERHRPRTSKFGTVYLLTGVLKDHEGNPFYGGSAKSGQHLYYYNKKVGANGRKTVKKEEIEKIVTNRIRQYLQDSGTVDKLLKAALQNRMMGLPLIDEQLHGLDTKIATLDQVITRFSETIRQAALSPQGDLLQICATLAEEKTKAQADHEQAIEDRRALQAKREAISNRFENSTLPDFLKRVMTTFDTKNDLEKKALVQAIIPEIIIHADNTVELKVNPDPNGRAHVSPCYGGGRKVVLSGKWRANVTTELRFSSSDYVSDFAGKLFKPLFKDPEFLHQKYVIERRSIAQIATEIFSSRDAVRRGLRDCGIMVRAPHRPHGRPSQPTFGTKIGKGSTEPHLGERRAIQVIFDLHTQGLSLRQIAKFLTSVGVPTKCRGKRWHPEMVKRILGRKVDATAHASLEATAATRISSASGE